MTIEIRELVIQARVTDVSPVKSVTQIKQDEQRWQNMIRKLIKEEMRSGNRCRL
ncbi:hypothetical protein Sps_01477 [Shewanella psychrophila]|uniref:Uncharacterized protein n=1 Tax=Shewanella psychrophila TaxID=225848 RepID=A0A1S6HMA1_9GAMM|nr:DUF5908 family protein [Shewanella psychrophila]AQS36643.1 hypothetical protein Sps_01477 [Shewanella psychrophila]